jgi:hypothetical protein
MTVDGRRGSVKQDANGSWMYIVDTSLPGGPRKQARRRGFKTKKSATAAMNELIATVREGTFVTPTQEKLAEYLQGRWLPAIASTIRTSTLHSYERNMRLHVVAQPIGQVRLQSVEASMLNRLYADLLTASATAADFRPAPSRTFTSSCIAPSATQSNGTPCLGILPHLQTRPDPHHRRG